ncbi:hypothetical protein ACWDA3_57110 [Nonomuraea rubra]
MWHALNEDVQVAIDQVRRTYGAALFDYCHTTLATTDAELAACGALLSAYTHAARLTEPEHLRAWLFALARAHRGLQATTNPASNGSWTRPDATTEPLLQEALTALPAPQREVLDLSLRYHLTDPEIALIFDAGAIEVEHLVHDAANQLETWVAARAGDGCPDLTTDAATPGRRRRTLISRHLATCTRCRTVPRTATATDLLHHLPIAGEPATMAARLTSAEPLPADTRWRSDGFPEQAHPLITRPRPGPGPHIRPRPSPPGEDFRAWERRSHDSEEFWTRRADESDPEARLSLRPLLPALRVGALIAAAVASVLAAGAVWTWLQPDPPSTDVTPAAAPITLTLQPTDPLPDLEEPPADHPTTPASRPHRSPRAPKPRKTTRPRQPDKAMPGTHPATGRTPSAADDGPQSPPATATRGPSTTRKLPKPAPPAASLSPSSLTLGAGRSGTFTLSCTGTCQISSGTGSAGITISGTRVTVSAPASRPSCTATTETGTATITWSGTTTGDGHTTEGTTTADGALTLTLSWTVEADKGDWIPTGSVTHGGDRQGYWSHCRNG